MNNRYFERRLIEEAAQRATDRRERSAHLRARSLLYSLLGLRAKRVPLLACRPLKRLRRP